MEVDISMAEGYSLEVPPLLPPPPPPLLLLLLNIEAEGPRATVPENRMAVTVRDARSISRQENSRYTLMLFLIKTFTSNDTASWNFVIGRPPSVVAPPRPDRIGSRQATIKGS
ncbi:hypothetical protein MLD38_029763 [Melastoma candidum]|nr:hypothetical protein MLD38_029763 [Melastoma candidum]